MRRDWSSWVSHTHKKPNQPKTTRQAGESHFPQPEVCLPQVDTEDKAKTTGPEPNTNKQKSPRCHEPRLSYTTLS